MRSCIRAVLAASPVIWLAVVFPPSLGADTPRRPDELTLEPLTFSFPSPDSARLANSITVYLFPSHELPLVTVDIRFRMGTRFMPVEQHAAGNILDDLWDTGGTRDLAPEAFEDTLAALDATVSAWMGSRVGGVRAFFVSEDMDAVLPLWRDTVLEPRWDADRLDRAKKEALKDVQSINNDPESLASHHFSRLLLGSDYPGIHVDTRGEIDGVDRETLVGIHRRFVHPENAVIGVAGDFDTADMLARLDALFADWKRDDRFGEPVAEPWTVDSRPGVYYLPGDYDQAYIRIGRVVPGLDLLSPDYPDTRILGFGLGWSRVFYRTRGEGLSYGTGVFFSVGEETSYWRGFGSGRTEVAVMLLQAVREEVGRIQREPLTGDEVETARTFILGTEIQDRETPRDVVSTVLDAICRKRPAGYLEGGLERLRTITADDLKAAAARYLPTDSLVVLVVGKPEVFLEPLAALGWGEPVELEAIRFGE